MKISFKKNDETRYALTVSNATTYAKGVKDTSLCGRILSSTVDVAKAPSFDDKTVESVRNYYSQEKSRLNH